MEFTLVTTFALGALPPVFLWLFFWRRRLAEPEPNCVLFQLFFFGVFAFVPLMILREYFTDVRQTTIAVTLGTITLFAFAEELLKGLALIGGVEANRSRFDKWEDGFEFAVAIALGFAFAENTLYFLQNYLSSGLGAGFALTYVLRSCETMLAHILFTGTLGAYYAYAYVAPRMTPKNVTDRRPLAHFFGSLWLWLKRPLHITYAHVIRGNKSQHGHHPTEILIEGLIVATLLHAGFNAVLTLTPFGVSLSYLAVPLVIGFSYWWGQRLKLKK